MGRGVIVGMGGRGSSGKNIFALSFASSKLQHTRQYHTSSLTKEAHVQKLPSHTFSEREE